MFDTRVVRGVHRIEWPFLIHFFGIYSIILSLSQWNLNKDNSYCDMTFDNTSSSIKNICSDKLYATNVLWVVILIVDSLYITTFLIQRDFRTGETNQDRLNIRSIQKRQFILSFIVGIVRICVHLARFGVIISLFNTISIILTSIVFIIILLVLVFHIRLLSLTSYDIRKYSTLDINDITPTKSNQKPSKKKIQLPGPATSSDDDNNIDRENPPPVITTSSSSKPKRRPKNGIVF